jgi:hypothetical protein
MICKGRNKVHAYCLVLTMWWKESSCSLRVQKQLNCAMCKPLAVKKNLPYSQYYPFTRWLGDPLWKTTCLNLWSSGQSSWLQIQRSGFDSRRYQTFWEVVGLERGPLNLVSTIEGILGRKSSGSGLESKEYGRIDQLRWPRGTLYLQTLALTSPTSGSSSASQYLR